MVSQKEMEVGPLFGVSIDDQRRLFSRWKADGNKPADHFAVKSYRFGLPTDAEMTIVDQVSVDQKRVERSEYLSCSSCSTKNKFKDNGWLVSGGDGYWYIIGPDCWGSEHRSVLGRAVRDYKDSLADEFAEKRINRFYRHLGNWVELFRDAERVSRLGLRAQSILKGHRRIWSDLRQIRRDGGDLYVHRRVSGQDKYGDYFEKEDALYAGTVQGLEITSSPFECTEKVKIARRRFESVAGYPFSKQVFADKLFDAQQTKKIQEFSASVKVAEEALKDLAMAIIKTARFFSADNLNEINGWYRAIAIENAQRAGFELSRNDLNQEPRIEVLTEEEGSFLLQEDGDFSRLDISAFIQFSPELPYSKSAGF
jgi:hypothetical protein